jgi:hypothetical protein
VIGVERGALLLALGEDLEVSRRVRAAAGPQAREEFKGALDVAADGMVIEVPLTE